MLKTWRRLFMCIALALLPLAALADSTSLLAKAQTNDATRYAALVAKNAEIRNTTDNQSFSIWWQPAGWTASSGVIVALHGHGAYATSEAYLWQPYAEKYGYAVLTLQWWFGGGDETSDYYRPEQMYPLISAYLKQKGVKAGTVLFTGFSRGSANSYAVAVLDNTGTSSKYFGLVLSNAGTAASGYPPNQQIASGLFGSLPFSGMRWAMYCGERDPDPTINGCAGMLAAKDWVTKYGATVVLFIDDPTGDHGGFMTNSANVETRWPPMARCCAPTTPCPNARWARPPPSLPWAATPRSPPVAAPPPPPTHGPVAPAPAPLGPPARSRPRPRPATAWLAAMPTASAPAPASALTWSTRRPQPPPRA
ncbi:MAG: hypothetical protein IPP87_05760 [Ideonella sp.]|nr:hypothetical protein [Ideonella sp.]